MDYPSFAESRNLDSNRSAFADRKSITGAAHRQIRWPRKTSNQLNVSRTCQSRVKLLVSIGSTGTGREGSRASGASTWRTSMTALAITLQAFFTDRLLRER